MITYDMYYFHRKLQKTTDFFGGLLYKNHSIKQDMPCSGYLPESYRLSPAEPDDT